MDLADSLADRWCQECQRLQLATDSYHALRQGLSEFLSADALGGIAFRDEHPFVVALTPGVLLCFAPPDSDQFLDALAIPLSDITALAVACANASTVHANYRVCTWTLRGVDSSKQTLQTRHAVGAGFDSDSGGEGVMLALAEQIGWPTPLWQKMKEAA